MLIRNFLFGGILFSIIDYVINNINNPSLGAIISMIPIGFLTVFIIKDTKILKQYIRNIFFVIIINLIVAGIFYIFVKNITLNSNIITIIIILIWIIFQYLNFKLNYFKNEPVIIDDTK